MALNYVNLTVDAGDGSGAFLLGGFAQFSPSALLTSAGTELFTQVPVTAFFRTGSPPVVRLLGTDSTPVSPTGWNWQVSFGGMINPPAPYFFQLPFSGGGSQSLSAVTVTQPGPAFTAYMPLSGGAFTGPVEPAIAGLTDAATIAVNAGLGNLFRVTLAGNRTLANPAGGTDGQLIRVEVTQDATGGRTLSYGSAYDFGSLGQPSLSSGPGKMDVLGFGFDAPAASWRLLAFAAGF